MDSGVWKRGKKETRSERREVVVKHSEASLWRIRGEGRRKGGLIGIDLAVVHSHSVTGSVGGGSRITVVSFLSFLVDSTNGGCDCLSKY